MRIRELMLLLLISAPTRAQVAAQDGPVDVIEAPEGAASVSAPPDAQGATPEGLMQPPSISLPEPEPLPPGQPCDLTIEGLVELALANNPSVAQAGARVDALRGRWVQAGLPPNPSVGFVGSELGNDGKGGQNGGFAGQDYITGGKLRLDQAVVAQEIQRAEQRLFAAQLRVTTDVRRAAFAVLIAQRRVQLANELVTLGGQAVEASRELQDAQEIPLAGLLQSEVEQQNAAILLQNSQRELTAAWQRLAAVTGTELQAQPLAGDVTQLPGEFEWEQQLARITATSPELGAAAADVMRAQVALQRARVEPIPNISTQASVQYDESTNDTIAGLQVGVPLPLWNRNQGGIRQAQAEVAEARRNAARVELDLKRRLADAFQSYAAARAQAETYVTSILPKSRQTLELAQRGYRLGEVGYLDILTAQRTYSQTNLAYLDALSALWASWAEIEGLLLSGSLAAPPQ